MTAETAQRIVRGLTLPADLRTVHLDGTHLAYREQGAGHPVVFIHGSISDLTTWDGQLPAIAGRYRAIAYSRRYAWPNDDLPRGAMDTIGRHVDDLLAFLRAVDAYPAHLVGNSWGALIALTAAIRDPAAVRSLVLEEPPLVPLLVGAPPAPARILRSLLRHPRATVPVLMFGATTLRKVGAAIRTGDVESSMDHFVRGVLGDAAAAGLSDPVRQHMRANSATHVGQFRAAGGFEPISERQIRSVATPSLVVIGEHSPAFLRRPAHLLASLLPDSRTVPIPAASHGMHFENPVALNAELLRFLDERVG